jgi:hypothetical protein
VVCISGSPTCLAQRHTAAVPVRGPAAAGQHMLSLLMPWPRPSCWLGYSVLAVGVGLQTQPRRAPNRPPKVGVLVHPKVGVWPGHLW